jgi:flagellar motor switch protein FliG
MFTFDDFLEVPDQELRTLVNSIDKKTLMVALKGASEELEEPLLSHHVIARSRNVEGRLRE